jgi:ribosomal protein L21E
VATKFLPFEVVFGFNPCVRIDLVHLPIDERTYMDGIRKAELMKKLHQQVRLHIEEKTTKYAKQANKGWKMVRFEPGDLVWIHISKGRFPSKHKSKLMPRVDGPFRIIEKVNDNAYKVDLSGDYNVSSTFNVKDLTPYLDDIDDTDLRTNHSQPGVDDVHHGDYNPSRKAEPNLQEDSDGPITRARAKQLQRALTSQIGMIEAASKLKYSNLFRIGSKVLICLQLKLGHGKSP